MSTPTRSSRRIRIWFVKRNWQLPGLGPRLKHTVSTWVGYDRTGLIFVEISAVWGKHCSSPGTGGYIRYASGTCINHLKYCVFMSSDVRDAAMKLKVSGSPQKKAAAHFSGPHRGTPHFSPYHGTPRFSPYHGSPHFGPGAITTTGMHPSGSGSSQMLPPSSLPPSRHDSPAVYFQTSTFSSPANSIPPSPQLSVLSESFPSLNTLPLQSGFQPVYCDPSPAMSSSHSLHPEGMTPQMLQSQLDWSQEMQRVFEIHIARLTAAATLPLSWVDNPEWIDLVRVFFPIACKSPSRKVLTSRLIPLVVGQYRESAKASSKDQNATIQADGWTGINFHHLLAFMITVKKKVGSTKNMDDVC